MTYNKLQEIINNYRTKYTLESNLKDSDDVINSLIFEIKIVWIPNISFDKKEFMWMNDFKAELLLRFEIKSETSDENIEKLVNCGLEDGISRFVTMLR